jgi:alcohol dehydrogenase YqhD (iron-dependent ADH family)
MAEGLMRSLVHASRIAVKDPTNYEARSNISWVCTWALNTLIACGKSTDWEVHMIGQAVGALTDATHGMTLSAVSLPYYRLVMPYGVEKFARFARAVWNVDDAGKSELEVAQAGLEAMSAWMDEIGVVKHLSELGFTEDMIDDAVKGTFILTGGYHPLTQDEVAQILRESM